MGLFDHFPYTNFHELNLDWILKALREIETTMDQFVAINVLKYADPIQWDITRQYEKNTIVIDPLSGTAYISVAPVPIGVALTNTDYWCVVFNLEQFVTRANNNFTLRVEEATTLTATFATNAGQWLVWGGHLYEAIVNIVAGDQYVIDSNIKRITVEDVTGDLVDLNTAIKTNLVAAINSEIAARIAADQVLDNSIVIERDARVAADQVLDTSISAERDARVAADNTLDNSISTERDARVAADNALDNSIVIERDAREAEDYKRLLKQENRKYILIFDSYGALGLSTLASAACPGGCHVLNVGGAGFCGAGGGTTWVDALRSYLSSLTPNEKASYTDIMVFGGINDYGYMPNVIISSMTDFNDLKNAQVPQCNITLCPVSWSTRMDGTIHDYVDHVISAYSLGSAYLGWSFIDGLNAFIHSDTYMQTDGIHPTNEGAERLGKAIATLIKTGVAPKLTTQYKVATFTPDASGVSSSSISTIITDNEIKLSGYLTVSYPAAKTVQSGATNATLLGTLSNSYYQGNVIGASPANTITVPAYIHNTATNTWELKPITLQIYYFYVFISVEGGAISFDAIQTPIFEINSNLNMA